MRRQFNSVLEGNSAGLCIFGTIFSIAYSRDRVILIKNEYDQTLKQILR